MNAAPAKLKAKGLVFDVSIPKGWLPKMKAENEFAIGYTVRRENLPGTPSIRMGYEFDQSLKPIKQSSMIMEMFVKTGARKHSSFEYKDTIIDVYARKTDANRWDAKFFLPTDGEQLLSVLVTTYLWHKEDCPAEVDAAQNIFLNSIVPA